MAIRLSEGRGGNGHPAFALWGSFGWHLVFSSAASLRIGRRFLRLIGFVGDVSWLFQIREVSTALALAATSTAILIGDSGEIS